MLRVNQLSGFGGAVPAFSEGFYASIQRLGISGNCKLCLDPADSSSYGGSGQTWSDLSGNSYDWYLGSGSGSDSADPIFNGSAGGLSSSEFWSFGGGDYFTQAVSEPSWINNLHKANALLTVAGWINPTTDGGDDFIFATCGNDINNDIGVHVRIQANDTMQFIVFKATGAEAGVHNTVATVTRSAWNFFSIAIDEAGSAARSNINGTQRTTSLSYTSPSASSHTDGVRIGADGTNFNSLVNGTKMGGFAIWEQTALAHGAMAALFNRTRARYGI